MFSHSSSSLLSSLFSSSPIFPSVSHFPSNSSAFVVPSSVSSSAFSDALHALSLQLLLDQHRNSLLRSILSLTSTVPFSETNYSNPLDFALKIESLVKEEEENKKGAEEAAAGGEEWRESKGKKTERRRGKKRTPKERAETEEERKKADEAKRKRTDQTKRRVFRLQKGETETDSPVSGMFIKESCDEEELRQATAELDESAPFVNVTEETREAISAIPNVIGESICALCKIRFGDVFRLAMHKCPRIRHEEYRCDECEKVFGCPANLASHRRWHRPNTENTNSELFDEFNRPKRGKTKAKNGRDNRGREKKRQRHWEEQTEKAMGKQMLAPKLQILIN
ncbi:hypothetical protein niasHT_013584 [Heterodera trifolii]|uniref:C2H2-type domain-containing protein n=1 Tax=Heterodera trifolii TaxID=157864 RepID=A0ABD2LE63_9BILA